MKFDEYTQSAIKTESVIDEVEVNIDLFINTISICIKAGNILDMLKKQIFYGKDIDSDKFKSEMMALEAFIKELSITSENLDDPNGSYQENVNQLSKQIINTINPRVLHGIIGLHTESTELLEAAYSNIIDGNELDVVNISEEIGDQSWYTAILLNALGLNFDDILVTNNKKLEKRYGKKFTTEAAINRDLESERDILDDGYKNFKKGENNGK